MKAGIGVAMVLLGGCEHGQVPGLAFRNPQIQVSNNFEPVDPNSPSGATRAVIEVQIADSSCTPLDGSFGGTFRGAPMTVATFGGNTGGGGEFDEPGFCEQPRLTIDPTTVDAADDVISVFDDSGAIDMTFEADDLDHRSIDVASLALQQGVSIDVRWSHPEDLQTSSLILDFRQTFQGDCFSGCFGEQFTAFGSINGSDPAVVTFQPFFSTGAQNGEVVIRGGTASGQLDCDAMSCSFNFQHVVVVPASATL